MHETTSWVINHVVGPMNLGTLIAGPREHIVAQARMLASGDEPDIAEIERFCAQARELFRASGGSGGHVST